MGRYHRYEQWEIDRIVKLHSVGHDVLEIASITGANKFSIYRILEKNGCKLNGNIKVTDEIRAGIENAIRSGAMEAQLCAQYNLSNTTIRTIRRQAGLRFANDARPVDAEQFAIEKIG